MDVKVEIKTDFPKVEQAVEKAAFKNMGHGAASIRKTAVDSIQKGEGPSAPGSPPHTRRRQLNRAIVFAYDRQKQEAVVGPRFSVVGEAGAAHEKGGESRGTVFPPRPYMFPALEQNLPRFAEEWRGSVVE